MATVTVKLNTSAQTKRGLDGVPPLVPYLVKNPYGGILTVIKVPTKVYDTYAVLVLREGEGLMYSSNSSDYTVIRKLEEGEQIIFTV